MSIYICILTFPLCQAHGLLEAIFPLSADIYIYMHIYIHMCIYMYISMYRFSLYVYVYIHDQLPPLPGTRPAGGHLPPLRRQIYICIYMYMHIHIYVQIIYICICILTYLLCQAHGLLEAIFPLSADKVANVRLTLCRLLPLVKRALRLPGDSVSLEHLYSTTVSNLLLCIYK